MSNHDAEHAPSAERPPVVGRINPTEAESYPISPPGTSKVLIVIIGIVTILVMVGLLYLLVKDIVQVPGSS